jgi:hypothetical protein
MPRKPHATKRGSRPGAVSTSTATASRFAEYLNDWIDSHAMEIKPRTLAGYRSCIRLYVSPRVGKMRLVHPSTITKLYNDLLTKGGNDGKPLAYSLTYPRDWLTRRNQVLAY